MMKCNTSGTKKTRGHASPGDHSNAGHLPDISLPNADPVTQTHSLLSTEGLMIKATETWEQLDNSSIHKGLLQKKKGGTT